jgi:hypothetical protein
MCELQDETVRGTERSSGGALSYRLQRLGRQLDAPFTQGSMQPFPRAGELVGIRLVQ